MLQKSILPIAIGSIGATGNTTSSIGSTGSTGNTTGNAIGEIIKHENTTSIFEYFYPSNIIELIKQIPSYVLYALLTKENNEKIKEIQKKLPNWYNLFNKIDNPEVISSILKLISKYAVKVPLKFVSEKKDEVVQLAVSIVPIGGPLAMKSIDVGNQVVTYVPIDELKKELDTLTSITELKEPPTKGGKTKTKTKNKKINVKRIKERINKTIKAFHRAN